MFILFILLYTTLKFFIVCSSPQFRFSKKRDDATQDGQHCMTLSTIEHPWVILDCVAKELQNGRQLSLLDCAIPCQMGPLVFISRSQQCSQQLSPFLHDASLCLYHGVDYQHCWNCIQLHPCTTINFITIDHLEKYHEIGGL
jgi:hypothetical protein